MKIWVDAQCLQSPSWYRGIGRYVLDLLTNLAAQIGKDNLHISLNAQLLDESLRARSRLLKIVGSENIHYWYGVADQSQISGGENTSRQISRHLLNHHVLSIAPDVAICLAPFEGMTDTIVPFSPPIEFPIPSASLYFDAIPHQLPEMYLSNPHVRSAYYQKFNALSAYDALLCISEYSKTEAKSLFTSVPSVNIGCGLSEIFTEPQQPSDDVPGEHFSVTYIGGLDPRKNLRRLIQAVAHIYSNHGEEIELRVIGDYPPNDRETLRREWAELGLPLDNLVLMGFLSDPEVREHYKSASLVVLPSLLEGFGLTALEGLMSGGKVIASNAGAIPEVVGEDRLLFDPTSASEIADKILWAMKNPTELSDAVEKARSHGAQFTWERTAERTEKALSNLTANTKKTGSYSAHENLTKTVPESADVITMLRASESHKTDDRHLFIDISSTAKTDHKTGIQRVVRKITERQDLLRGDVWSRATLVGCHQDQGFFETRLDRKREEGVSWDHQCDRIVPFGSSDTLVLPDSSWEFYQAQSKSLKLAALNGTQIYWVMHDLIPLRLSAFCDAGMPIVFAEWFKSILPYTTGIVCVSKSTADQVLMFLEAIKCPRSIKVGYWHLGANIVSEADPANQTKNRPKKSGPKRFLSVGTIEPRKGQSIILDAFELLWSAGGNQTLTFVGKAGWGTNAFIDRLENHPEMGGKLRWLNAASDADLVREYSNSDALIAASYGEGFGLPIVEAKQLGLPILASDIKVFREVAGEKSSSIFFEPGAADSLAEKISKFRRNRRLIKTQTPPQTWDESVLNLHDVIGKDNWYKTYVPQSVSAQGDESFIGTFELNKRAKIPHDRKETLSILRFSQLKRMRSDEPVIAKVKNLTDVVWASHGTQPVNIIIHKIKNNRRSVMKYVPIPLVFPIGDEQYFNLGTIGELLPSDETRVQVSVFQEGFGELSNVLELKGD